MVIIFPCYAKRKRKRDKKYLQLNVSSRFTTLKISSSISPSYTLMWPIQLVMEPCRDRSKLHRIRRGFPNTIGCISDAYHIRPTSLTDSSEQDSSVSHHCQEIYGTPLPLHYSKKQWIIVCNQYIGFIRTELSSPHISQESDAGVGQRWEE